MLPWSGSPKAKVVVAVALGPILAAAATAAITVVIALVHSAIANTLESNAIGFAIMGFLILSASGAAAAFLVSVTIGLCWHSFSQTHGWTSVRNYWLAGMLVGLAAPLYFTIALWDVSFTSGGTEPTGPYLAVIACPFGAALGGLTAFIAWLIRRPDRDAANPPTSAP